MHPTHIRTSHQVPRAQGRSATPSITRRVLGFEQSGSGVPGFVSLRGAAARRARWNRLGALRILSRAPRRLLTAGTGEGGSRVSSGHAGAGGR